MSRRENRNALRPGVERLLTDGRPPESGDLGDDAAQRDAEVAVSPIAEPGVSRCRLDAGQCRAGTATRRAGRRLPRPAILSSKRLDASSSTTRPAPRSRPTGSRHDFGIRIPEGADAQGDEETRVTEAISGREWSRRRYEHGDERVVAGHAGDLTKRRFDRGDDHETHAAHHCVGAVVVERERTGVGPAQRRDPGRSRAAVSSASERSTPCQPGPMTGRMGALPQARSMVAPVLRDGGTEPFVRRRTIRPGQSEHTLGDACPRCVELRDVVGPLSPTHQGRHEPGPKTRISTAPTLPPVDVRDVEAEPLSGRVERREPRVGRRCRRGTVRPGFHRRRSR